MSIRMTGPDLEVTGVSRSGRVRKKSSKLTDFESPDEIDNRYKRRNQDVTSSVVASPQISQLPPPPPPPAPSIPRQRSKPQQEFTIKQSDPMHNYSDEEEMTTSFVNIKDDMSSDSETEYVLPHAEADSSESLENGSMDEDIDEEGNGPHRQDEVSAPASSLYMMEKASKKKLMIKDGKVVGRVKTQRKDKGKTRFTAYMLWAKEVRQAIMKQNPEMDFATMSKRLGELWSTVPNNEKYNWKRRAKRLAVKGNIKPITPMAATSITTPNTVRQKVESARWKTPSPPSKTKYINKNSTTGTTLIQKPNAGNSSRSGGFTSPTNSSLTSSLSPEKSNKVVGLVEPILGPGLYKVVGTQPVDVAAHLKLLGESLSIIGERLKEHEGQIAVSGSLSVLLDSLLCALGPLTCLTHVLEETDGCPPELLTKILDNIAYFMPGL